MRKECYVISRVNKKTQENYPVRVFISRQRAEEYKNVESKLSGERWLIDKVDIEVEE
jgi:hypothetical protein